MVGFCLSTQLHAAAGEQGMSCPHDGCIPTDGATHAINWITHHKGLFGGIPVAYTAKAGETIVVGADNQKLASIFSVAYVKDGGVPHRPVMFIFNGGPGASSASLHISALGPRRVTFPKDLQSEDSSSVDIIANNYSPLDAADLVFIDPPQTGLSLTLPSDVNHDYASIMGDARIVAAFIQTWLRDNGRDHSPKFLLGESYGATRAALVADDLSDAKINAGRPIRFSGLILVSQLLTVDDLGQRPMNAAGYAVNLPTMAAVAWYHGRVDTAGRTFEAFLEEARQFAFREYMPALMFGHELNAARQSQIAAKLSAFTGVDAQVLLDHNLMLTTGEYRRDLLQGHILGKYDGRYIGPAPATPTNEATPISDDLSADPAWNRTFPRISSAVMEYLRDDLHVSSSSEYIVNNDKLAAMWNFGGKFREPASAWLVDTITRNPDIHLFAASGYDDFAAPFTGTQYLMAHLALKPEHGQFGVYPGGHQFYTDSESLKQFATDLRGFMRESLKAN